MSALNCDVKLENLYFIENEEDECWEILEKDGVDDGEDAIIAKFYYAPELAVHLLDSLKILRSNKNKCLQPTKK